MAVEVMLFSAIALPRDPVLSTPDVSHERSWLYLFCVLRALLYLQSLEPYCVCVTVCVSHPGMSVLCFTLTNYSLLGHLSMEFFSRHQEWAAGATLYPGDFSNSPELNLSLLADGFSTPEPRLPR